MLSIRLHRFLLERRATPPTPVEFESTGRSFDTTDIREIEDYYFEFPNDDWREHDRRERRRTDSTPREIRPVHF